LIYQPYRIPPFLHEYYITKYNIIEIIIQEKNIYIS